MGCVSNLQCKIKELEIISEYQKDVFEYHRSKIAEEDEQ